MKKYTDQQKTFQEQEEEWLERLCMCRQSLFFLKKEMKKLIKQQRKFEQYYLNNKDQHPSDIDFVEFEDAFSDYKQYLKKQNELGQRGENENNILKALAEEAIKYGYLHE